MPFRVIFVANGEKVLLDYNLKTLSLADERRKYWIAEGIAYDQVFSEQYNKGDFRAEFMRNTFKVRLVDGTCIGIANEVPGSNRKSERGITLKELPHVVEAVRTVAKEFSIIALKSKQRVERHYDAEEYDPSLEIPELKLVGKRTTGGGLKFKTLRLSKFTTSGYSVPLDSRWRLSQENLTSIVSVDENGCKYARLTTTVGPKSSVLPKFVKNKAKGLAECTLSAIPFTQSNMTVGNAYLLAKGFIESGESYVKIRKTLCDMYVKPKIIDGKVYVKSELSVRKIKKIIEFAMNY